jgi:hypothetical protein
MLAAIGAMFTAGAAGEALMKILSPLLSAFLNSVGKGINDNLAAKRSEQTIHDLGVSQTTSIINKESADDERRANEVAVNRPDVDAVVSGLERGDEF